MNTVYKDKAFVTLCFTTCFCVSSTAFEGPVDSECKLFQESAECAFF
jgi:hypothetical protein